MKKVEIKSKRYLLDDFFKVEEVYLRYERYNGEMSEEARRLNFERGDGVAAILFNRDSRRVILIEQFRYPAYEKGPGWVVESIAGMLEEGEEPEEAMRRDSGGGGLPGRSVTSYLYLLCLTRRLLRAHLSLLC